MKRLTTVGLLLVVALFAPSASVCPVSQTPAQEDGKVGLVVRFADGSVVTDCIDYSGPGMTGEDVLDESGLALVKDMSYGLGAAICKIAQDGCSYPQEHCFCQCEGADCQYWAYYQLDRQKAEWVYSGMGLSGHTVEPGDVEGWAWGNGELGSSEVEPPVITFEELCAPLGAPGEHAGQPLETPERQPAGDVQAPRGPQEEHVILDQVLLLLGVGAGTVGFGTFAFVGMILVLIVVYLRARTQF